MIDERQRAVGTEALDEGAWIYLVGHVAERSGEDPLRACIAEICEARGWSTVGRPLADKTGSRDPGHLFEGIRHAVEHSDCVIALLGDSAEAVDAELALAYSHRRPIVGIRISGAGDPASGIQAMIEDYERARVVACDDLDDCATGLNTILDDPEFAATMHRAAGEHAESS